MNPSDHEPRSPIDRALDVLLDEALGGTAPPDLSARILDASRDPDSLPSRTDDMHNQLDTSDSFELLATGTNQGLVGSFVSFMSENAKWWMIPFMFVFGLLGLLLVLGATGAAPFIYALF